MRQEKVTNLYKRNAVYYYRIKAPALIAKHTNITEFKKSLGTADYYRASKYAYALNVKFDNFFKYITRNKDVTVNEKRIREMAQSFFDEQMTTYEFGVEEYRNSAIEDFEFELNGAKKVHQKQLETLKENKVSSYVISSAKELIESNGYDVEQYKNTMIYNKLLDYMQRAYVEASRIFIEGLEGNFDTETQDKLFNRRKSYVYAIDENNQEAITPPKKQESKYKFGELVEKFIEEKIIDKTIQPKQVKTYNRAFRIFNGYVKNNHSISKLNKDLLRKIFDDLSLLPPRWSVTYQDMTIPEILPLIKKGGKKYDAKTLKKTYYGTPNKFFNWCVDKGYLDNNPMPQFTLKTKKYDKPRSFSDEQLHLLFSSPIYTGCKSISRMPLKGENIFKEDKYWIMLLQLFTGMRIGEVAQLKNSNFHSVKSSDEDIYFIKLTDKEILKNYSSKRDIPIHQDLVKIGLIDHVKQFKQKQHVFEKTFKVQKHGSNILNYMSAIGVKDKSDAQYGTHSFRHTLRNKMSKCKIPSEIIKDILGHEHKDVTFGTYGDDTAVIDMYNEINKVKFDCIEHLFV